MRDKDRKHLDTAEFKAKKIVEQAHEQASDIIAEADHNAERKVKIAQIHADGIVSQAEQTAEKAKQEYPIGSIRMTVKKVR